MSEFLTRYGYSGKVTLESFDTVADDLIRELKTEEFEEPDDEHTQVSVSNELWSVTAQVSGLITLDSLDFRHPKELIPSLFMRDIEDGLLRSLWYEIVTNANERLASRKWTRHDELPDYKADFYRVAT